MREISAAGRRSLPEAPPQEAEYVYLPEAKEAHLRDYWKIFLKRRWVVLLVFLVVMAIGAHQTYQATPLYTAKSILKIESQNPKVTGIGEILSSQYLESAQYDYYQTQFKLLEGRPLAAKVIRELRLEADPVFTRTRPPGVVDRLISALTNLVSSAVTALSDGLGFSDQPQNVTAGEMGVPAASRQFELGVDPNLIDRYLRFLKVKPVKNTRLVEVTFSTPDPGLSQKLANAHVSGFVHMNLETRFELTQEARDYLGKKLVELRTKVERSEQAFNAFRKKHNVVSLEGGEDIVVQRLIGLNNRLTEARTARIDLESLYSMVKNKNVQHLSKVIDNSLIQQLKSRLDSLEIEAARLSTVFRPDHPRLLEINKQISEAQQRMRSEINSIVRNVESEYAAARAREQALQTEAQQQQQAALNMKELGVEYTMLKAEVDASRAVYDSVLSRLNETNVSNDTLLSNMQVADPAERPTAPSSPNAKRNMQLAAALGLVLGVGLAFFLEYLDGTLRTPADVSRAMAVPTLGIVPHLGSLRRAMYGYHRLPIDAPMGGLVHPHVTSTQALSRQLIVSHHPLSVISEAYRNIRTLLLLSQSETPPQVLLLTSAHPGEGKTTTTLNLGITLAQGGRPVLVIDADMRKGNCHHMLGLPNVRGLSHVLTADLSLDTAIQNTPVANLSFLPRGFVPPDPSDLLGSPQMKELITQLRSRFEFILLDAPPAIALADAVVLSALSDGVLLVLREHKTTSEAARRLVETLDAVRANILGVILNAVNIGNPDYSDYRYHYSSYYANARKNGA